MTAALTPAELAAMTARAESAAALAEAARGSEWVVVDHGNDGDPYVGMMRHPSNSWYEEDSTMLDKPTAAFIAASRTAVPALAADVLSLAALYTAGQAALTKALAELTAARAELEEVNTIYRATKKIISSTPCGDVVHDRLYEMGLLRQDE